MHPAFRIQTIQYHVSMMSREHQAMPIYGHLDLLSLAADSDGALFGLVI